MTENTIAQYMRLTPSARQPVRGTQRSAGLDVCADLLDANGEPRKLFDGRDYHEAQVGDDGYHFVLQPGCRILIPTGLAFSTSDDVYTRVAPRSGLAIKQGLAILGGVVDADYVDEVGIICANTDLRVPIDILHGTRIAQLILEKVSLALPVEVGEFVTTQRVGGFGSTGMR